MENFEKLSAKEAVQMVEENQLCEILKRVEQCAKKGFHRALWWERMLKTTQKELKDLGYVVTPMVDELKGYTINW